MQHAAGEAPPAACPICEDERQYVGLGGQAWASVDQLADEGYRNSFSELEPGLHGIRTDPQFGIGPRGLLVQTERGNVLFDCPSLVDAETVKQVEKLGGLHAITASHPHFYGAMVDWSQAFGGAAIYLAEADRRWVMRHDDAIVYWEGSQAILPGLLLVQCGGHFAGSAVLHWAAGAQGRGALFTGDTVMVAADRRWVSFMRSYPNYIPLAELTVARIVRALEGLEFDRIYGNPGWEKVIESGAKDAVLRSAQRYEDWLSRPGL